MYTVQKNFKFKIKRMQYEALYTLRYLKQGKG